MSGAPTGTWDAVHREAARLQDVSIGDLFANDPARFRSLSFQLDDLLFDFSKVSPGKPIIICKPSSKPFARIIFAASSVCFTECPLNVSFNTISSMDCAPNSMVETW